MDGTRPGGRRGQGGPQGGRRAAGGAEPGHQRHPAPKGGAPIGAHRRCHRQSGEGERGAPLQTAHSEDRGAVGDVVIVGTWGGRSREGRLKGRRR